MEMLQANAKWLAAIREKAKKDFDSFPFPQERDEAWRYTDMRKLKIDFRPSDTSSVALGCDNDNIIAADLATALQKYPDLWKKYFGQLAKPMDKIISFHLAHFSDGIFVYVPKNMQATVSAVFESANAHNIIAVEEGASLNYSEELVGDTDAVMTDATEVFAGEDAQITFNSLQSYGLNTNAFSAKAAALQRNAGMKWMLFSAGARFHRLDATTYFNGEGASAETISAFLSKGQQHTDITTNAFHNVPHTTNNILAKGVLLDKSTAVYRGLIRIEKPAQKTNSYLSDHMLMVGDEALANSIPSLQIGANDVKASHGSTKGYVDEEQLFYLESRGLERQEAEQLIVQGFLVPAIMKMNNIQLREKFAQAIGIAQEGDDE
ncbi:MAG: Fe-S cluster assembly protein SufD [Candidatus Aenigmarchaeota archaeon]|nr:Fe-S cluster assembly protein SufD [Candidatus Aenigmarchaeota archaeon]